MVCGHCEYEVCDISRCDCICHELDPTDGDDDG